MNANELKLHLDNKKDGHICSNSDIGYVTLPLFMLSQKLFAKIGNLLDKKYNLSNSQIDVLASLYSAHDEKYTLTPTKLYERLLFSSGGMTKVLKKLEKKGFIKRLDNEEDKRSKLVQLTPSGNDILEKSLADVIELEEAIFAHIKSDERKSMSDLLFKALDDIE
ncbi:MarR family transcriptional regulator [Sulfurimonas sp.]|uniref:MarR family winged helix-turn-helix transcriptional regulator n=1 Tax=Sulfurimonas sp. TaxID=2022749 RepID=UPI002AB26FBC|nr:MarR family transcriptional regulator [Sulfurimonas sp.]